MGHFDPTTSTFLPFALETCGAFGADAYGLLKALARRKAADSPASALELGGVDGLEAQTSRWLQHFVQSVSVQLQRALAVQEVYHGPVTRRQARARGMGA